MTDKKAPVSKTECDRNMEIIMLKFQNQLMERANDITDKFEQSMLSVRNKFEESLTGLRKEFVKRKEHEELKSVLNDLIKRDQRRQYEWLKYAIVTAISILIIKLT